MKEGSENGIFEGVSASDLSLDAFDPNLHELVVEKWRKYGCFVVRGLNQKYVAAIDDQVARTAAQSIALEKAGQVDQIKEGWVTPDGTLFIPAAWDGTYFEKNRNSASVIDDVAAMAAKDTTTTAIAPTTTTINSLPPAALHSDGTIREKQIMVLGLDYFTSSSLLRCTCDEKTVDIVAAIFQAEYSSACADPVATNTSVGGVGDDVEVFGNGQLVYKEPSGGHLVHFHQDAAFFEFAGVGPVGTLNYTVDTDLALNNGPLYVLPGSHSRFIEHQDTSSHLGLDPAIYNTNTPGMVAVEGKAGDSIFFHQYCVHGSPPNHSQLPRPTFINRYTRPTDEVIMPLATSVAMRKQALEDAKTNPPKRERGLMVRGERRPTGLKGWGKEKGGQFH